MSPTSHKLRSNSDQISTRSILLCGASVRSLAESAIAAGLRPLCIDFFEDADLTKLLSSGRGRFVGQIDSFTQLPQMIRSTRKSIPLLWAGGLENHTDVLREISQTRVVIGAAPDIVESLRNPWILRNWLSDAAIDSPRLATEGNADSHCSWLQKSMSSSGGLGIGRHAQAGQPEIYLQEYIDGVPMSATFCLDDSGLHLFGMSLQLIGWPCLGATGFLFCGNVGPVNPGDRVTQQVLSISRIIADNSGIRGVFGLDFILRQGQAWLLEVNPRLTASHMLYELQQPGLLIHRQLGAFGWMSTRPPRSLKSSKPGVSQSLPVVSARLIFWAKVDVQFGHNDEPQGASRRCLPIRIADYPQPGSVIAKSGPLCSLHLTASEPETIERQLTKLETGPGNAKNPAIAELFKMGFSALDIAGQLRLLRQKFERNCG
jgi:predicted ATP-grasp superfamily ATP-dependent carboligase